MIDVIEKILEITGAKMSWKFIRRLDDMLGI